MLTLDKWIARGKDGKYVIKRLKNANEILTPATLQKMKKVGDQFKGKNYDLSFEWSDDKIFCTPQIVRIRPKNSSRKDLLKGKDFSPIKMVSSFTSST